MVIKAFPPIEYADETGLLAIGGDLDVESLLLAYSSGIFPWPLDDETLAWFSPPDRAILLLDKFHVSKRLHREINSGKFVCSINKDFSQVIEKCAESKTRKSKTGTWITREMIEAYKRLHEAGHAHSVECWLGSALAGGLYGVSIGRMFAGESMFFDKPNASKIALAYLVNRLKFQGCSWIDCQVLNPHSESLGAEEVSRDNFIDLLRQALSGQRLKFSE